MASGDILACFYPPGEPPASNYATFDTRNQHPVADFDDTVDEALMWTFDMPTNYGGGGIRVTIKCTATSATSGDALLRGTFERLASGGQDVDSNGFAAANEVLSTTNGTSGVLTYSTIDFTDGAQIDSIVAGDLARFKLTRTASDGTDTMAGDLEVHSVVLKEL